VNKPNKFIKTLSDTDYNQLLENYQTSDNFGLRRRSHAILLSLQKYPIDEIARICGVHRTTVGIWIAKWNENKDLADGERSGRPSILTVEEQEQAFQTALKNPRFPSRQLGEIKRETGKEISPFTLKRLIKKRLFVETNQVRVMEKDG
jgi:transposase